MQWARPSSPYPLLRPLVLLLGLTWLDAQAADSFPQKLERLLQEHQLIRMVNADVLTADKQIAVEQSAYFPQFGVQGYTGTERIDRDTGTSGRFKPREASAQINQLITDFGATSARVDAARTIADKERSERDLQVQNLLLAAVEAQLKLIRAHKTYQFALESEANVRRQTQLENARVEAGRGYATDVLQAKAQLAGAEARRVGASLQLSEAVNRYRAVFGDDADVKGELQGLQLPDVLLPDSEDTLERTVLARNPDAQAALARQRVAQDERTAQVRKELMPRVDVLLSRSQSNELDGIAGNKSDTRALLRLNWNFDFGMRAMHLSDSTAAAVASATAKTDYVRVQASEEARSAWANWQMSKARAGYLVNQVNISTSFLDLARRERELGRRSLLDLLNGEVALTNARSDALAARIDETIAAFRVMRVTGRLSTDLFRQPGILVDANAWDIAQAQPAAAASGMPVAVTVTPVAAPAPVTVTTPAPAPAPVPAPSSPATSAVARQAAADLVERWRAAWAARDADAYLATYADDFKPAGGLGKAAWQKQRRQRIASAGDISLALYALSIDALPSGDYLAEFEQDYRAGNFADRTRKRLVLRRTGEGFAIVEEQVVETLLPTKR